MHQKFSIHTTPKEFKNLTISHHFGFVLEEGDLIITMVPFSKSFILMFSLHMKKKSQYVKMAPVW